MRPAGGAGGGRAELSPLLTALDLGGYSPWERPPAFAGHTADGAGLALGDLRGKVVVLTFWATWCVPCRTELPVFEALRREIGAEELAVVAVNARERAPAVREYAQALGLTFALLLDRVERSSGCTGSLACRPPSSSLAMAARWPGRSAHETGRRRSFASSF